MQIPNKIRALLTEQPSHAGAVDATISQFEPWIKNSKLPLFPEYTDHGIAHLESVLSTAVSLVRDDAWRIISSADAAILTLAIILHDCAMHISEDGFLSLLEEKRSRQLIPGSDDKPWNVLWEEYYAEAVRFDGRKLMSMFGDLEPVSRPPKLSIGFSKRDRLLIGEFVRRHHARLAEEIAHFGVPSSNLQLMAQGFTNENKFLLEIAGLVARSHGLNIRKLVPRLDERYSAREYKKAHPAFLMALLRVADYLQIDSDRAPLQHLQVNKLSSPFSQGEWKAHQAIRDIRTSHEDPEAIFIDALPLDVATFLRINEWQRGIQSELDASWAALGEIYGRYKEFSGIGLVLRRVRSSLDDLSKFSTKVEYLPVAASFRSSGPDLLKLLIEPLYGNRPEVGLREFIQNAVDAVRELQQFLLDHPQKRDVEQSEQSSDVLIAIEADQEDERGHAWITITDRGIGMTSQIILEYFLTAGASFRHSEGWKKLFETAPGVSKVLRAGRFGIGALAGFLLGPEIYVSTRHVNDAEGICFTATIDSEVIELKKCSRPVGTTVRIRIDEDVAEDFADNANAADELVGNEWDWFCHASPTVERVVFGKTLAQTFVLPDSVPKQDENWRVMTHQSQDIMWTYSHAPILACNGILVDSSNSYHERDDIEDYWEYRQRLNMPNLNILDPNGQLPLNLQRTNLTETPAFFAPLAVEVSKDLIAFALSKCPHDPIENLADPGKLLDLSYPGTSNFNGRIHQATEDWYLTDSGLGYLDTEMLNTRAFKAILVICLQGGEPQSVPFHIPRDVAVVPILGADAKYSLDMQVRALIELIAVQTATDVPEYNANPIRVLKRLQRNGGRILISRQVLERAREPKRVPGHLWKLLNEEWSDGSWSVLSAGDPGTTHYSLATLAKLAGKNLGESTVIAEFAPLASPKGDMSLVASTWKTVIGEREIPWNTSERMKLISRTSKDLAYFLSKYKIRS